MPGPRPRAKPSAPKPMPPPTGAEAQGARARRAPEVLALLLLDGVVGEVVLCDEPSAEEHEPQQHVERASAQHFAEVGLVQ